MFVGKVFEVVGQLTFYTQAGCLKHSVFPQDFSQGITGGLESGLFLVKGLGLRESHFLFYHMSE